MNPGNRRRLRIIVAIAFFSQWSGNGLVSYYLSKVFATIGITDPTIQVCWRCFIRDACHLLKRTSVAPNQRHSANLEPVLGNVSILHGRTDRSSHTLPVLGRRHAPLLHLANHLLRPLRPTRISCRSALCHRIHLPVLRII